MSGCSATATQVITVDPTPTVVATASNSSICSGDSTILAVSGATTYMWMPGNLSGSTVTVSPSSTTTYTVTGTTGGCSSTATQMITVNSTPTVTATASNNVICAGDSTTITVSGATAYSWMPGNMTGASATVSPSSTVTYTITGTDGPCSSSTTQVITVNPLPSVNLGSDTTQCGGAIVLDAQNAGSSYLWSTSATSQTITVSSSGTYMVDVTDANSCSSSDTISVTINALPSVTTTASNMSPCVNDGLVTLTGLPAGGTWSGPGVTGNSFNPTTAGTGAHILTYTYTDSNGCTSSSLLTINVNPCTGVSEQLFANGITFYPNPSSGVFTLAVNANVGDLDICIVDAQGRTVYASTETNVTAGFTKVISLEDVASGFYLMKLSTGSETQYGRVMIQR